MILQFDQEDRESYMTCFKLNSIFFILSSDEYSQAILSHNSDLIYCILV